MKKSSNSSSYQEIKEKLYSWLLLQYTKILPKEADISKYIFNNNNGINADKHNNNDITMTNTMPIKQQ